MLNDKIPSKDSVMLANNVYSVFSNGYRYERWASEQQTRSAFMRMYPGWARYLWDEDGYPHNSYVKETI